MCLRAYASVYVYRSAHGMRVRGGVTVAWCGRGAKRNGNVFGYQSESPHRKVNFYIVDRRGQNEDISWKGGVSSTGGSEMKSTRAELRQRGGGSGVTEGRLQGEGRIGRTAFGRGRKTIEEKVRGGKEARSARHSWGGWV